jgi:pimeloyl-ACP methyl ester carboxylesterase
MKREDEMKRPPPTGLERLEIEVGGFRFDAVACGPADGSLVLFLHGFPEFAEAWADIMGPVGEAGYRAVAVDQRGYSPGARPPEVADYATDRLVADALGFAAALGAGSFHLVGHDWGGIVAWKLAAEHRMRLKSLCVLSTPHTDALLDARRDDPDQRRRSSYITMFRLPFHIAERILMAGDARNLRAAFRGKLPAEQIEDYVRRFREPGTLTAALNWYRALDLKARIGSIAAPTLFIWGTGDQALGRKAAEATRAHVAGPYTFHPLPDASHWLLEEAPRRIHAPLLEHLSRWR